MEDGFLRTYFGKKKEINNFAKQLIFANQKNAALELNNVIRILGDGADPSAIIKKITKKYNLAKSANSQSSNTRSGKLIKVNYFPKNLIITINGTRVIDGLIEKRSLVKINEFKVYNDDELYLFNFWRDYYENEDEINLDFSERSRF